MDSLLIIKTISILVAVLLLLYLCLRVLKTGIATGSNGDRKIKIIEVRALDARSKLFLVEVEGKTYLLSTGATMIHRNQD